MKEEKEQPEEEEKPELDVPIIRALAIVIVITMPFVLIGMKWGTNVERVMGSILVVILLLYKSFASPANTPPKVIPHDDLLKEKNSNKLKELKSQKINDNNQLIIVIGLSILFITLVCLGIDDASILLAIGIIFLFIIFLYIGVERLASKGNIPPGVYPLNDLPEDETNKLKEPKSEKGNEK